MQFVQNITNAAVAVAYQAVRKQCGAVGDGQWSAIGAIAAALVTAAMHDDGNLKAELHEMPDDYPHRENHTPTIPTTDNRAGMTEWVG